MSRRQRFPSHTIPARALTAPSAAESQTGYQVGHGLPRRRVTDQSAAMSRPETEAELRVALAEWWTRPPADAPAWCRFSVERLLQRVIWTRDERRQAGRIVHWYGVTSAPPAESQGEPQRGHHSGVRTVTQSNLVLSLFPGVGLLDRALSLWLWPSGHGQAAVFFAGLPQAG
jgi:hypothetical protein